MSDFLDRLAEEARDHSIFAPSSSATWLACAGSLVPAACAPNDPNFYSAEGTVAHTVADIWLRSGEKPVHMLGTTIKQDGFDITVDAGMLAYVEQYVEVCEATPGSHHYETKAKAPEGLFPIPGQGGTADFYAMAWQVLRIKDLKFGKGIKVFAERNSQPMSYALYVFYEWDWLYDFQTIEIEICQPRLDHFDRWTCSRAELVAFGEQVRDAARLAWAIDAPRTPGAKQCEGCNRYVRRDCPAYLAWFTRLRDAEVEGVFAEGPLAEDEQRAAIVQARDDLDPLTLPAKLPLDVIARVLTMRGAVEKWFSDIEARLFAHCYDHGPAFGKKVVEGRSNRAWIDPTEAEIRMADLDIDPLNHTTKSPNQAEEAIHAATGMPKSKARKLFESYTESKPGALSLVDETDKRQAITNGADFDAMIEEL